MLKRAPFWQPGKETLKCMVSTDIDSHRCADEHHELLNFAESFQKLKCSVIFDERF